MKRILRFFAWIGDAARRKLNAIEEREAVARAIPNGTRVRIVNCACRSSAADHVGDWIVERYNVDAGDYKLTRPDGSAFTFVAERGVIKLQEVTT